MKLITVVQGTTISTGYDEDGSVYILDWGDATPTWRLHIKGPERRQFVGMAGTDDHEIFAIESDGTMWCWEFDAIARCWRLVKQ